MIKLGARLKATASLVRQGVRVADIGTDHAYLPAFLIQSGRVVSAIACDIGDGPLMNAAATLRDYDLQDLIELRKCDGLEGVEPDEVDDIFICGMGGELIARIIDAAEWTRDGSKQLILQPMSAVDDLRIYLANNGYTVVEERLVKDSGRLYTVMLVRYSGKSYAYSLEYPEVGTITANMQYGREYLERQLKRVQKHANMLLNSNQNQNREEILEVISAIKKRLEIDCDDGV